ncbi:MAG: peptidoglycan DD-metalloendopeptidase family protein [Vicinamibacterales bacterium]
MLTRSVLLLLAVTAAACSDQSPTAPTITTVAASPPIVVPLPTAVPGVLSLAMPIELADLATTAFGLLPFGFHGADHAEDGHPGWDIEYRIGGTVRAAAAGTVQSVFPDPSVPGRTTVQLEHVVGTHFYRTVYTNLATVNPDIVAAATVRSGQALGTAGTVSQTVGTTPITYAMIHFQLDDFEYYREIPNPNAVTPEPFLSADAKLFFDRIWSTAVSSTELVEPYASNPRDLRFPASRTWMRVSGDGPAGIRFTRASARSADYEYAILTEAGTAIESGTVTLALTARPFPSIDLVSGTGRRLGMYDIVSDTMRLSMANAGESRPTDLGAASTYRTPR